MPEDIKIILDEFINKIHNCVGNCVNSIIVYGSYARGDYNERSDIDIMILVSSSANEIKQYEDEILDFAFDLELEYGKILSPIIKNQDFFDYWSDTLPFYQNVKKEGVKVA